MSTIASRKISRTLSTLAVAALSVLGSSAMAEEELQPKEPLKGFYGGIAAGVGVNRWQCGDSCDRARLSGKLFGGMYLTPSMAMEINYFVFGGMNRAFNGEDAKDRGISAERQHTKVLTLGVMKEFPLLENFTSQMRIGVAHVERKRSVVAWGSSESVAVRDHTNAIYVGLGLGFEVSPEVKLLSTLDYVVNGRNSHVLMGVGALAEF